MKKVKLLAVALVLGTMTLFANNDKPLVSKEEIRKQIYELVHDTENTLVSNRTVTVTFTFNTSGEVVVLKVGSRDEDVISFIREKLNGKKLENPGKAYKPYTVQLKTK